jgi:hypothetical protein
MLIVTDLNAETNGRLKLSKAEAKASAFFMWTGAVSLSRAVVM